VIGYKKSFLSFLFWGICLTFAASLVFAQSPFIPTKTTQSSRGRDEALRVSRVNQSAGLDQQAFIKPYETYNLECGHPGGRLILSTSSDPKSFNPIVAAETSTTQITSLIFEGLTRTDPLTMEVKPCIAKSWETSDGKTWIFHLRPEACFSDGVAVTADDVVFTFNQLIYNPDMPSGARDIFTLEDQQIKVEKIDKLTVRFELPFPFAPFLRSLSQEILPKHKYETLVKEKRFTFSLGLDTLEKDIVGSGPCRFKKYVGGERVELERNPFYWGKDAKNQSLPYLEKIIFIILPSPDTAMLKFMDKEIDFYTLRPRDLSILGPRQKIDGFNIYNAGPDFGSNFLALNQNTGISPASKKPFVLPYKSAWFRDPRFRQAVSYAVNREKIVDLVFNGLAKPAYSPESPANKVFYSDDVQKYPYDPVKAKELLRQAGFVNRDAEGILEDKEGRKLEINFVTNAGDSGRLQIAVLIKKDFEDIGFKVNFLPLDFNSLVGKLTVSLDWDMVLIGFTGGIEPYFGKNVWSYKGTLHLWNLSGKPAEKYEEEIENIFNLSARELDENKRKTLFYRWQNIVSLNLPLIYTVSSESLYAVRDKFGNLYPTVYGGAFGEIEYIYEKCKIKNVK
jgi:peptide/nickel transport system substrate-binding protein